MAGIAGRKRGRKTNESKMNDDFKINALQVRSVIHISCCIWTHTCTGRNCSPVSEDCVDCQTVISHG